VKIRSYDALTLNLTSRLDQICFKPYAAADQGPASKHVADLRQLEASRDELLFAARWTRTHDPSPAFRSGLVRALGFLGVEDAGDEL
jgi:hypothetical protein